MRHYTLTAEHQAVLNTDQSPARLLSVPVAAVSGIGPGDVISHPAAPDGLLVLEGQHWMDEALTVLAIPVDVISQSREADA